MTDRSDTTERTTEQNEWLIVFNTLREAQERLESIATARHSWMDGAVAIAKERAGV